MLDDSTSFADSRDLISVTAVCPTEEKYISN